MASSIKVENVVNEPINPIPNKEYKDPCTCKPNKRPKRKAPIKLTVSVPIGKPLLLCIYLLITKRAIAPIKPPIEINNISFIERSLFYLLAHQVSFLP